MINYIAFYISIFLIYNLNLIFITILSIINQTIIYLTFSFIIILFVRIFIV